MMHEQRICTFSDSSIDQSLACSDAADEVIHLVATLNLQTIGTI